MLGLGWTLAVALSLTLALWLHTGEAVELASRYARTSFDKDVLYRAWNAGHGGVYAPATQSTQPNPLLADLPDRDAVTTSGRALTLINPAYMTRQVYELGRKKGHVLGRVTSLRPVRVGNEPDPWERSALESFRRGAKEGTTVETMDGREYVRLMRPLTTDESCLKCHAKHGYKLGDIRGGISIAVPMAPFNAASRVTAQTLLGVHGALWLLGLLGIRFGWRRMTVQTEKRRHAEAALVDALAQADRANMAKSEFLSRMSHELRTPMNAILGFGQLLEISPPDQIGPGQRDYVDQILGAGQSLLHLNDEILGLTRMESGWVSLNLFPMPLSDLIEECLDLSRALAVERNVTVINRVAEVPLPHVRTDAERFKEILLHLLSNALKYNRPQGTVVVDCAEMTPGMMRISITDTGPGIPEDKRSEVFRPFSRLETKDTVVDGTGIGLTVTRTLIDLMGGRVDFESVPGQGSTFWIEIPIADGDTQPDSPGDGAGPESTAVG